MKPKKNTPKPLTIFLYVIVIGVALIYKNIFPEDTPTNDVASIILVVGILVVSALVKRWQKRDQQTE